MCKSVRDRVIDRLFWSIGRGRGGGHISRIRLIMVLDVIALSAHTRAWVYRCLWWRCDGWRVVIGRCRV